MENNYDDIKKLRALLLHSGQRELSEMLNGCYSYLDVSSTFGSKSYSRLSTFQIHAPLLQYEKLKELSLVQLNILKKNVKLIYPTQNDEPEIRDVEVFPDVSTIPESDLVNPENLIVLNLEFINDQIRKCKDKIDLSDFDGAITNARTLLETVCLYILEKETGEEIIADGNLPALHKKVSIALKMDSSLYEDTELKKIISGSFSIVTGISALRNSYSDSHGHIRPKYKLSKHHAVLIVNLAKSMAEFLYSSWQEKNNKSF